jgi:uncharacterized OsmC-like protein
MSTAQSNIVNGLDTENLHKLVERVSCSPREGIARFSVTTEWKGGTRSETRVDAWHFGGKRLPKRFRIESDEPNELCGHNTQPNPQEYLMAAFNACMMVGYVAGASIRGIELDYVEIETEGELDLRGFLGLDKTVKPGYDAMHYVVRIKGNGTPEQFKEIHDTVNATSPNRWNIANPIKLTSELIVA